MAKALDSHFLALTSIITALGSVKKQMVQVNKNGVYNYRCVINSLSLLSLLFSCLIKSLTLLVVLSLLVLVRGLRLGLFLLMRILQWGENRRFDKMRNNLGKLAVFWIFQAVWVWTVSLPVTIVNASGKNPSIQALDIVGWIMWSIGFSLEATADQQKLSFKNFPSNRGKWCNIGVWKYSGHPNYFGELPVLEGAEWLVIVGPVFLTLLLLFLSGIPLLEDSSDKKFGNVAEYRLYKKATSPLIPLPPEVYGNLPLWFKKIFLFEFSLYSRNLPRESFVEKRMKILDDQDFQHK